MSITIDVKQNKIGELCNKSGEPLGNNEILILALELEFKTALLKLQLKDLNIVGSGYSGLTRVLNDINQSVLNNTKSEYRTSSTGAIVNPVFEKLYTILEKNDGEDFDIKIDQNYNNGDWPTGV
jgi:hypothetical protein